MIRKITPQAVGRNLIGPGSESKKVFPTFRIELVHLPEAKKWEIGHEYTITLKLKQTGISISKFQNDAEFDIIGIDPKGSDHNSDHNSEHKK